MYLTNQNHELDYFLRMLKKLSCERALDNLILHCLQVSGVFFKVALKEGEDVFLLALRDVVQAQLGMRALAEATRLNRENLYSMLSENGNPRWSSITAVLEALNLSVAVSPKPKPSKQ